MLNTKALLGAALWLGTLGISLFTSLGTLSATNPPIFDTCRSFNTPLHWVIVGVFLILTAGVGVFLHQLLGLPRVLVVIGLSGIGFLLMLFLLVVGNGCP